jgi:hypothetical protein
MAFNNDTQRTSPKNESNANLQRRPTRTWPTQVLEHAPNANPQKIHMTQMTSVRPTQIRKKRTTRVPKSHPTRTWPTHVFKHAPNANSQKIHKTPNGQCAPDANS